jgi:hypothetical protein
MAECFVARIRKRPFVGRARKSGTRMMTDNQDQTAALDKLFAGKAATDELTEEDKSKDAFSVQLAEVAEAMIARHGKDFAMGSLVLAARFIAEGKPLIKRNGGAATKLS